MDFGDPWALLSSVIISCAGASFFMYGRKAGRPIPLIAGLVLGLYPYFVTQVWLMWAIAIAIVIALYMLRER